MLFKLRREVHGVADNREFEPRVVADGAEHDRPDGDSHPHPDR